MPVPLLRPITLGALIALCSLLIPAQASSQVLLDDEFDDGFVAPIYNDLCISGAAETGGAYRYPGPTLGCFAAFGFFPAAIIEVLEPALIVPGNVIDFEVRLDRLPVILPEQLTGELVGIGLNPLANTSLGLNFFMQRFPGSLDVLLYDPTTGQAVQAATVSTNPDSDPSLIMADTIEMRLVLGPNIANEVFPIGLYRLCSTTTCLSEVDPPFTILSAVPGSTGSDSIALAAAARLTLQGLAQIGVVDAFAVERLTVPEPESSVMLFCGVLTLIAVSRRTRRHSP